MIDTNHPHKHRIPELVSEVIESANNINYEWDEKNIDWPIDENSIVWEVGAYRGRWAYQIAKKYNPVLFCFEPQVWAWDVTRHVLKNHNAICLNYALGDKSSDLQMGNLETDGASFEHNRSGFIETCEVREISEVMEKFGIIRIDLMLMNIEGYEYKLIPHMFKKGIYPRYLSVQFHGYTGQMKAQYEPTRAMIAEKYNLLWDYGMTLSGWELKDD